MEYNINFEIIEQRLNAQQYNSEDLHEQTILFNNAFSEVKSNPIPKLVVALNSLSEDRHETFLNGWPNNVIQLSNFITEIKKTSDINHLGSANAKNFHDVVNYFKKNHIKSFFINSDSSDEIELKTLNNIPDQTKYLYPIRILGRIQFDTSIGEIKGVVLPNRVVLDAKRGLCKILIHDVFEGRGHNLYETRKLLEKIKDFYNIPASSLGFLDSNYYTPYLQKIYQTKGFFFPYWEKHLVQSYIYNNKNIDDQIENRLFNQLNLDLACPYYIVNLNRRLRPHRTLVTLYNSIKWSDKILWSYTEANSQKMSRLWGYLEDEKIKSISTYINGLPKIIDVASDVNDVDINILQFRAYFNLVTETTFFEKDTLFVSEKVYKPILLGQPFVVVGNSGILSLLKEQGYETFSPYINEDYDKIIDPSIRLKAILKEIDRLCNMSEHEIKEIMYALHGVCVRNRRKIISRITENISTKKIVEEIFKWVNNEDDTL